MIYLDNAATTKICDEALEAMEPYLNNMYGNPSGLYHLSKQSKEIVEKGRRIISEALNTKPENIFFTSGGTESDNWVLEEASKKDLLFKKFSAKISFCTVEKAEAAPRNIRRRCLVCRILSLPRSVFSSVRSATRATRLRSPS